MNLAITQSPSIFAVIQSGLHFDVSVYEFFSVLALGSYTADRHYFPADPAITNFSHKALCSMWLPKAPCSFDHYRTSRTVEHT